MLFCTECSASWSGRRTMTATTVTAGCMPTCEPPRLLAMQQQTSTEVSHLLDVGMGHDVTCITAVCTYCAKSCRCLRAQSVSSCGVRGPPAGSSQASAGSSVRSGLPTSREGEAIQLIKQKAAAQRRRAVCGQQQQLSGFVQKQQLLVQVFRPPAAGALRCSSQAVSAHSGVLMMCVSHVAA